MMSRRTVVKSVALGMGATAASSLITVGRERDMAYAATNNSASDWRAKLGETLSEEHDYSAEIEGKIPEALKGTLYRNGPGRFDRGGIRKNNLLDGDGMIQAFRIQNGKASYQNKYVRTKKFLEEEEAGKLINETWTTRAPGGFLKNLGPPSIKSQAGVTPVYRNGKLYAFDEVAAPYTLDPDTLETLEPDNFGTRLIKDYKAHTKIDPKTNDWIMFGTEFGPTMKAKFVIVDKDGNLKSKFAFDLPRPAYMHDFFASDNYLILNLQPASLNLIPMMAGTAAFSDALNWDANKGNLLVIVDKNGTSDPIVLEAPAAWMWHSFNAYEKGNQIIADFVGYEEPDHFLGDEAAFRTIMNGHLGISDAKGWIRRYVIDLSSKSVKEEIISQSSYEFPIIHPSEYMSENRFGYVTKGPHNNIFHSAIAKVDFSNGNIDEFDFGEEVHVGEAIFAPEPGSSTDTSQGWLMSIGLDGTSGNSFLAILDAQKVSDGPVAKINLTHHTPLSFHGFWQAN